MNTTRRSEMQSYLDLGKKLHVFASLSPRESNAIPAAVIYLPRMVALAPRDAPGSVPWFQISVLKQFQKKRLLSDLYATLETNS